MITVLKASGAVLLVTLMMLPVETGTLQQEVHDRSEVRKKRELGSAIRKLGGLTERVQYLDHIGADTQAALYGPFASSAECLDIVCKPVAALYLIADAIYDADKTIGTIQDVADDINKYLFSPLKYVPFTKEFADSASAILDVWVENTVGLLKRITSQTSDHLEEFRSILQTVHTQCHASKLVMVSTTLAARTMEASGDDSLIDLLTSELLHRVSGCSLGRKKRDVSDREQVSILLYALTEKLNRKKRGITDVDLVPMAKTLVDDFLDDLYKIYDALEPIRKLGDKIKGVMENEVCLSGPTISMFNIAIDTIEDIINAIDVDEIGEAFIAIGEGLEDLGEEALDFLEDVGDAGRAAVREAERIGRELAREAEEAVREAAREAERAVREAAEEAARIAEEMAREAERALREAAADAERAARDLAREAERAARELAADAERAARRLFRNVFGRKKRSTAQVKSYEMGKLLTLIKENVGDETSFKSNKAKRSVLDGNLKRLRQKRTALGNALTSMFQICISPADILDVVDKVLRFVEEPLREIVLDLLEPILEELREHLPILPDISFLNPLDNLDLDLPLVSEIESLIDQIMGGSVVSQLLDRVNTRDKECQDTITLALAGKGPSSGDGPLALACTIAANRNKRDASNNTEAVGGSKASQLIAEIAANSVNVIRRECKETTSGTEYAGRTAVTNSGATCARWDSVYTESEASLFPEKSVKGAVNYCRNLDPSNRPEGPYCYVGNGTFEYCDIEECPNLYFSKKVPDCGAVTTSNRIQCGAEGTDQTDCEDMGCCFNNDTAPRCFFRPGQKKDVVKFAQNNMGGFPEFPNNNKNQVGRDTGINWDGINKASFEVAACGDIVIYLGENGLDMSDRQIALYIGYDNMYTSVLSPGSDNNYISPVRDSGLQPSLGILKCTEMRGFTLEWTDDSITLSRLGKQLHFGWPEGPFAVGRIGTGVGRGSTAKWRFHRPSSDYLFPADFGVVKHTDTVCQGESMEIRCDIGEEIKIEGAEYGRQNSDVCPGLNTDITCRDSRVETLNRARSICDGLSSCELDAVNSVFDPADSLCPGTDKYLNLEYSCRPRDDWGGAMLGRINEHYICEGDAETIGCDETADRPTQRILTALYGRTSTDHTDTVCPGINTDVTDCGDVPKSLTVIKGLCDGQPHCTVSASNEVFGDPCPGTTKYLKIISYCAE